VLDRPARPCQDRGAAGARHYRLDRRGHDRPYHARPRGGRLRCDGRRGPSVGAGGHPGDVQAPGDRRPTTGAA